MASTATITAKGQITLPKRVRNALGSRIVRLEIQGHTVLLAPVDSVAGSLHRYVKPAPDLHAVREAVWREVARDKGSRRLS